MACVWFGGLLCVIVQWGWLLFAFLHPFLGLCLPFEPDILKYYMTRTSFRQQTIYTRRQEFFGDYKHGTFPIRHILPLNKFSVPSCLFVILLFIFITTSSCAGTDINWIHNLDSPMYQSALCFIHEVQCSESYQMVQLIGGWSVSAPSYILVNLTPVKLKFCAGVFIDQRLILWCNTSE